LVAVSDREAVNLLKNGHLPVPLPIRWLRRIDTLCDGGHELARNLPALTLIMDGARSGCSY
jgi:hypothetical protein